MPALRTFILLLLTLVALAGAGCGGDDEPSNAEKARSATQGEAAPTTPPAETQVETEAPADQAEEAEKAEPAEEKPAGGDGDSAEKAAFVKAADRTCTDARDQLKKVQQDLLNAGRGDQSELQGRLADALNKQISITKKTTAKLEKLDPPSGLEAKYADFIDVRGKLAGIQGDYQEALEDRDAKQVAALAQKQGRAERKAGRLAGEMGIQSC